MKITALQNYDIAMEMVKIIANREILKFPRTNDIDVGGKNDFNIYDIVGKIRARFIWETLEEKDDLFSLYDAEKIANMVENCIAELIKNQQKGASHE